MLIKSKRLAKVIGTRHVAISIPGEISRRAEIEIHKAKQEAKAIREEAENVLNESRQKLQEAEGKAREIINSANIQAKEIKEKVYKETLQLANEEAEQIKQEARQLLNELFQVKREALNQAHNEVIKVAMDLAEKIIKYKATIDPNVLKTQVVEAIKRATTEADRVQVFVNPSDLGLLKDQIPEIENLFPSGIQIIPLSHESVDPGSCIIETKSGQLDASFSTQLKILAGLISHIEIKEPDIQVEDKSLESLEEELSDGGSQEQQREEQSMSPQAEVDEEVNVTQIPEEIVSPKKKRLLSGDLIERTKEEKEELDEDEELEEELEEKEDLNVKSILKPKKKTPSSEVSKIANEIEENPEWKNLIEDEE